jgi:hypothetical protein
MFKIRNDTEPASAASDATLSPVAVLGGDGPRQPRGEGEQ